MHFCQSRALNMLNAEAHDMYTYANVIYAMSKMRNAEQPAHLRRMIYVWLFAI